MEKERALVNIDTGEVVNTLRDGDRIVRRESIEYYKEMQKSALNNRHFVRVDEREGKLLMKELSSRERSLLFTLQYYVSYDSGLICHVNGKEIGLEDMVALTDMSKNTAIRALNDLIAKNVIYKGKSANRVQYFMNPWVANKGVKPNATLKEMFKDYQIRSKGNVAWKDLSD